MYRMTYERLYIAQLNEFDVLPVHLDIRQGDGQITKLTKDKCLEQIYEWNRSRNGWRFIPLAIERV